MVGKYRHLKAERGKGCGLVIVSCLGGQGS